MKLSITPLVAFLALSVISTDAFSQDSVKIKEKALFFADSLIRADTYENWSVYADLAPARVLKYYGGKDGFIEHVKGMHPRTVSALGGEDAPEIKIMTLMAQDDQWQCLIRESRYIHHDDNKKYHIVTYLLCQTRDDGETWRLFDLSYNRVANIIYMMPDVIRDMAIPEPYIISEEEELAKQQAAAPPAAKKAAPKKK
ncbi:MAG TPA: hypothetical protein VHD83_09520 [Puia sp.]|nr:hypothetical protein [Puia sp.]